MCCVCVCVCIYAYYNSIFSSLGFHMSNHQEWFCKIFHRSDAGHCHKPVFTVIRSHLTWLHSTGNLSSTSVCRRWSSGIIRVHLNIALCCWKHQRTAFPWFILSPWVWLFPGLMPSSEALKILHNVLPLSVL